MFCEDVLIPATVRLLRCVDNTQALAKINRLIEKSPSSKLLITRPKHTEKLTFLGMLTVYYGVGADYNSFFRATRITSALSTDNTSTGTA